MIGAWLLFQEQSFSKASPLPMPELILSQKTQPQGLQQAAPTKTGNTNSLLFKSMMVLKLANTPLRFALNKYAITIRAEEGGDSKIKPADALDCVRGKIITPLKYSRPENSGLTAEVARKNNVIDFQLSE